MGSRAVLRRERELGIVRAGASAIGILTCAALLLTACGDEGTPQALRPSGETLVATISSGKVGQRPWQVEVLREASGEVCLLPVAAGHSMGQECHFVVGPPIVVNTAVAGNEQILFVFGAVSPAVARLRSRAAGASEEKDVQISTVDGVSDMRYFGYATTPASAGSLAGYDTQNHQIYSDSGKIRDARGRD
jgi:hypothetical protein